MRAFSSVLAALAEPFTIEATVEIEPYNCAYEWEESAD